MLALAQTLLVIFAAGRKFRLALLLFAFLLAFAPRSTALALGGEGLAMTFQRMAILVLLGYLFVALAFRETLRRRLHQIVRDGPLVPLLLFLIFIKLFVTVVGGGYAYLPYVVDDAALSLGVFLLFATYIRDAESHRRLLGVVAASVIVSALLGLVELQLARPLVASLVDVKVQVNETVLLGRVREEGYRVQAFFDNPLALAELAVYSLPVALFGLMQSRGAARKWWYTLGVLSSLFLAYATLARSALLAVAAILAVYPLAYYWPKLKMMTRTVAVFFLLCLMAYTVVMAFDFMFTLVRESGQAEYWRYDSTERSTLSRARQYFDVAAVLQQTNYFGVGFRQNFSNELENLDRLDNYFLRLLLEGGALGLLVFLAILLTALRMTRRQMARAAGRADRHLGAMLISFVAGFAVMKLFVSMPGNNVYLFLMLGAYVGYLQGERSLGPVQPPAALSAGRRA